MFMEEGTSILDVSTLHEYDYADYLYQEHARFRDFAEYKGSDYYGVSHPWWIRLLIEGQLYCDTVTSLTTYLKSLWPPGFSMILSGSPVN